jgi:hypothetical protein
MLRGKYYSVGSSTIGSSTTANGLIKLVPSKVQPIPAFVT